MTIENPSVVYRLGKVNPVFWLVGFIATMAIGGIVDHDIAWYRHLEQGDSPGGMPYIQFGSNALALFVGRVLLALTIAFIILGITGFISRRHYRKISDRMI